MKNFKETQKKMQNKKEGKIHMGLRVSIVGIRDETIFFFL